MTHRSRRDKRGTRRRTALAGLLIGPAAALVLAFLTRSHHAPEPTEVAPELDAFSIEEYVEPAS